MARFANQNCCGGFVQARSSKAILTCREPQHDKLVRCDFSRVVRARYRGTDKSTQIKWNALVFSSFRYVGKLAALFFPHDCVNYGVLLQL